MEDPPEGGSELIERIPLGKPNGDDIMVRIRKNRPLISGSAPISRRVRRQCADRPYLELQLPGNFSNLCLGLFSATTAMMGCTIGFWLRVAGL